MTDEDPRLRDSIETETGSPPDTSEMTFEEAIEILVTADAPRRPRTSD